MFPVLGACSSIWVILIAINNTIAGRRRGCKCYGKRKCFVDRLADEGSDGLFETGQGGIGWLDRKYAPYPSTYTREWILIKAFQL
jgi:hypothetical protein